LTGRFLIGCFGRVRAQKGTDVFAEAMCRLLPRYPDFSAVIVTSGYRPEYAHWVHFPAFDAMGYPLTDNSLSTVIPGLYFCGVHFLRKRKSATLFGVGEDAAIVADTIAHHQNSASRGQGSSGIVGAQRVSPRSPMENVGEAGRNRV